MANLQNAALLWNQTKEKRGSTSPSMSRHPAELYNSEAKGQCYFSELSTFAEIKMSKRPWSSRQQVFNTIPYFGPFTSRRVTFVIEEARTPVLVDDQPITNWLDFTQGQSGGRSIKDRCMPFLHTTGMSLRQSRQH